MADKNTVQIGSRGLGVCSILGIIFIVLKALEVITWSWFWVLCPFWIGIVLFLGILVVAGVIIGCVLGVAALLDARDKHKRRRKGNTRSYS